MQHKILIIVYVLLFFLQFQAQGFGNEKPVIIRNTRAFAKLYGYIKYFHPSDEASKIDWNKFALLGVERCMHAQTERELLAELHSLFLPVAPLMQLAFTGEQIKKETYTPPDTIHIKTIAWQHYGVWLSERSDIYKSKRVSDDNYSDRLFDIFPKTNEMIQATISDSIMCTIPLTLYSDLNGTLGKDENYPLAKLLQELNSVNTQLTAEDNILRLADIVIAWNVFQHFYPYFETIDADWDRVLTESIAKSLQDNTIDDFFDTLRLMIATLNDGNGVVYNANYDESGGLPVKVEWIENQVVVTATVGISMFRKGDIIKNIDGVSGEEALLKAEQYISGSPQLKRYRALNRFGAGPTGTTVTIDILRDNEFKTLQMKREKETRGFFFNPIAEFKFPNIKELEKKIYYVNLKTTGVNHFNNRLNRLANAKAVIFDMRWDGDTNIRNIKIEPQTIISHLIDKPVLTARWNIPNIIYPDQKQMTFTESQRTLYPKKPRFKSKVIFIVDPSVISSGETYLGIIEHYKLADIVGQATAGCNGTPNYLMLPGKFHIMWTGMKVLKQDSTQHHLIGIQPAHPVSRTVRSVIDEKDDFLEKALEIARNL